MNIQSALRKENLELNLRAIETYIDRIIDFLARISKHK